MRVLFAGGGTAGHINPALAVAGFIRERRTDAVIKFVGTPKGLEQTLVPKAGFELYPIEVYGFKRKLTLKNIKYAWYAAKSLGRAKEIIRDFRPDVVVGTGGYVSGPVIYEAARMGIPTAIHEQNAYPGATTRMLSPFVDRVMISFPECARFLKKARVIDLVGNPVREEMLFSDKEAARGRLGIDDRPYLVSFGGSLGAREVNEAIAELMALCSPGRKIQHCHATGKFGSRWMPALLEEKGVDLKDHPEIDLREYIHNMPDVLAAADLVICRAGAITLSELAVMGKPSILLPSPNVTNNHQYYNALSLSESDAAVLIEEKDLSGRLLYDTVNKLIFDADRLRTMSEAAAGCAIFDSSQKIYDIIFELTRKSGE